MNSKWVEAQITVFAALIYSVVVSLIVTTVNSAAFSVGFLNADLVSYAGVESEFSQYFRPLADNFNVFGLEIIDHMDQELEGFMQRSLDDDTSLMPVKLSGVTINNSTRLTDNCGLPIKEQVVKYMKYSSVSELVNMLLGNEEYRKKCEVVQELSDKLLDTADILIEMDKNLVNAVERLDGLAVNNGTFAVKYDFPVYSGDTFLKMGIHYEDSEKLGILDGRVYAAVHKKCQSMSSILIQIQMSGNDSSARNAKCDQLSTLALDCRIAGLMVIDYCRKYLKNKDRLKNSVVNFQNEVEASKSTIGQEAYDGLMSEAKELEQFAKGQKKLLFDPDKMIAAVSRNNQTLQVIEDLAKGLKYDDDNENKILNELWNLLENYDFADMVVDYSEVKFVKDSGIFSVIKGLKGSMGKSMFGIITQGLSISKEKVNTSTLAMNKYSRDKDRVAADNTSMLEKALFIDYLRTHFDCFSSEDYKDGGFNYDLEFIYGGNDSDEDNLKTVITDMVNLREAGNLVCILTDVEKKREANAIATALLGFTGSTAIIKLGQYLLLTAWSYAESIMDVKRLVNGEKLELMKSRADWKMTLQRLLAADFTYVADNRKTGLDYKTHLLMLMMLEKEGRLYYATMAGMEIRLIALGFGEFRMENFLYGMNGQIEFLIRNQVYKKEFGYRY